MRAKRRASKGLQAGADEYLVKPFSARELLACVASQLQLARVRRETIFEQKKALAAKAYLAAIVDSADDAILSKDLNGIIQSCNASAERMFGYTSAELVGRPVRMLIPAERQSEEDDILSRLRKGERVDHFETVRMTKDGRRLDVALTISPVRDDVGTDHRRLEDRAGHHGASNRWKPSGSACCRRRRAVTETLNNVGAIVASDLDRAKVVQAVTDAATELTTAEFGAFFYNVVNENGESYTLYTISGVPREAFSKFPMPRNTEVFEPTFRGTGVVRSADITKDPRYGHNAPHHGMPAGHLPVRSYLAVPVKGRSGDVIGGLFFGHSSVGRFTEHHERLAVGVASWASVALENARMYMSVQEASRIKDDFLASLSHELRTPLNAILGYARMLRTGIVGPDKKDKAIETIERNATSLTQIVEDVLDISRIVSGKIRLNVQTRRISRDRPERGRRHHAGGRRQGVARRDDRSIRTAAPVSGDPERLQQVLWNLLSNAVKFTNRGGKVQVRLERVNSHLEVAVSDTGIGIAPGIPAACVRAIPPGGCRDRPRTRRARSGSVDCPPADRDARRNDRRIQRRTQSRRHVPGENPAHDRASRPRRSSRGSIRDRARRARKPRCCGSARRVTCSRSTTSRMPWPWSPRSCRRPAPASARRDRRRRRCRSLDADVPDVVVADLGMPLVDGFQFIDRVRRHPNARVREVPAAALTAYARSEDRMKALRAGFQIHLAKPIDPAELVTTIAALAKRFVVKRPDEGEE